MLGLMLLMVRLVAIHLLGWGQIWGGVVSERLRSSQTIKVHWAPKIVVSTGLEGLHVRLDR